MKNKPSNTPIFNLVRGTKTMYGIKGRKKHEEMKNFNPYWSTRLTWALASHENQQPQELSFQAKLKKVARKDFTFFAWGSYKFPSSSLNTKRISFLFLPLNFQSRKFKIQVRESVSEKLVLPVARLHLLPYYSFTLQNNKFIRFIRNVVHYLQNTSSDQLINM